MLRLKEHVDPETLRDYGFRLDSELIGRSTAYARFFTKWPMGSDTYHLFRETRPDMPSSNGDGYPSVHIWLGKTDRRIHCDLSTIGNYTISAQDVWLIEQTIYRLSKDNLLEEFNACTT